jgi:amino acid adenylation domain-containing protein
VKDKSVEAVLAELSAPIAETEFAPVTALFDSWVQRSPDEPALRQHEQSMGYGTLSERARAVARDLGARGCRPGDVVALDGWPGFGLIASLLGILLAGGVVLMVDRRLPVERRRLMCREAGARHLVWLSGEGTSEEIWAEQSWSAIVSVELASGKVAEPKGAPETGALPELNGEDGAYIFFTSGTTGVPKGVLGTHRGLSHFVAWQRTTFGVGPGDRSSQLTGLSFDVVLREIFLPLTSGATLCLPDEPEELGAEEILPWLEREGITTLHTVPTLAESWLLVPPQGASLSAMRRVFFAGEPLRGRLVRRWREAFGQSAQIVNLYGPTETTLAKCYYVVPAEPEEGIQPVGRPLPQSQALVLSEKGHPCGIGEWGEIVIRTPYRTRGYVNAPDENRRRFRPNPFRSDDRDLLYHTGDRGRFRADGMLEISSRLDDQVKINGVRVEPGEIAAVLSQYPAIHQSTVLGQKNAGRGVSLVAYVVPEKSTSLAAIELKGFLRTKLPEYMVPSSFVFLERLPLTPNGKVDRKALAKLGRVGDTGRAEFEPPRTATEELVAGIWAEVLGVERVGVEDNFFDTGGDSLLMMQVITRARLRGLRLTHLTMFRYPSVRSLAAHLSSKGATAPSYQGVRDRARRQREALARQKMTLGRS